MTQIVMHDSLPETVVLLTAGVGSRMGSLSHHVNKSLLPVNNKAIISHIIEQFPKETKFVVAVGFKGDMVKKYLSLAHSERTFTFVNVDNFDGAGAGPAYSVWCCKPFVEGAFTLVACDALYTGLNDFPRDKNYIGISRIPVNDSPAYCNVSVDGDRVSQVVDKKRWESGLAANGSYFIKDASAFWSSLSGTELSSGWAANEVHAFEMKWTDLGTSDKYLRFLNSEKTFDFSKTGELLYIVNGKVIKWFSDTKISASRIVRTVGREHLFPEIIFYGDGWYSYKFVSGDVLYSALDSAMLSSFFDWLKNEVWTRNRGKKISPEMCREFYQTKTLSRLKAFKEKYPNFKPSRINGKVLKFNIDECLSRLDWFNLCNSDLGARSGFIHGDLQGENIIVNEGKFTLIDWRQDFAGDTDVGDIYYDIAKFLGGLIINYDLIRQNEFTFAEKAENECEFLVKTRESSASLHDQLKSMFPSEVIEVIVSLIFLNMSPLHTPPFDKLLFCLALERLNVILEKHPI